MYHNGSKWYKHGSSQMNNLITKDINDDTPLRLREAARIAFPDGSISQNSLRREIYKGRLVPMLIAGKMYVTLRSIREMADRCLVAPKVRSSNSKAQNTNEESKFEPQHGSLGMGNAKLALAAARRTVKALSGN
jgi:hypothetical protein